MLHRGWARECVCATDGAGGPRRFRGDPNIARPLFVAKDQSEVLRCGIEHSEFVYRRLGDGADIDARFRIRFILFRLWGKRNGCLTPNNTRNEEENNGPMGHSDAP